MKALLPILVLFVYGSAIAQPVPKFNLKEAIADFPRSQLELRTQGPVSIEVNQGARAAYETLAETAGLNIVFDADFRDDSTVRFRIDNANLLDAFDALSARTGSFVEVLNARTIIVAPDNQTKRRDYELMVLKTFYLPDGTTAQRLTEMVTMLRTTLQARYLAISSTANAIIMRDTPSKIALAEKTMALSARIAGGVAVATNGEMISAGRPIFTLEAGAIHASSPAKSGLKPAPGSVSLNVKESPRMTFETLARTAGLNIIFDSDFRSQDGNSFKVENIDVLDALDLLALQTRTFWAPLDGRTIMVAPDNQVKRRELENVAVKTFYLPNASQRELTEIITALRTLLNSRYLALVGVSSAILVRDNPNRMALAERIIADLRKSGGVVTATEIPTGSESGFILNNRAARTLTASPARLQPRVAGTLSFDTNDSPRATYEAVAAMAGLRVVFDDSFKDGAAAPFKVQSIDIVDMLDFLSLQTRTIWRVMDRDTIFVAPDNPTVRAGFLSQTTKAINLNKAQQQSGIEIVTALRTLLNVKQVSALENSIVIQDTAENVAIAERIVSDLDSPRAR